MVHSRVHTHSQYFLIVRISRDFLLAKFSRERIVKTVIMERMHIFHPFLDLVFCITKFGITTGILDFIQTFHEIKNI